MFSFFGGEEIKMCGSFVALQKRFEMTYKSKTNNYNYFKNRLQMTQKTNKS